MDIQAEKYSLIEYITQLKDVSILEKLKQFVEANDKDFWQELSEDQQQEIKQGIAELDNGEKFDFDSVIAKHR